MKATPQVGLTHQRKFVIEDRHLIPFADALMPAVLATPHLIHEMERTAREALEQFQTAEERSVGTEVEVKHQAPGIPGSEVTCTARILQVNGEEIFFQIEASDSVDLLSRGTHRRRIVDVHRLRKRIERKKEALSGK